jgi:hypothetical protein
MAIGGDKIVDLVETPQSGTGFSSPAEDSAHLAHALGSEATPVQESPRVDSPIKNPPRYSLRLSHGGGGSPMPHSRSPTCEPERSCLLELVHVHRPGAGPLIVVTGPDGEGLTLQRSNSISTPGMGARAADVTCGMPSAPARARRTRGRVVRGCFDGSAASARDGFKS